jgi:tetratricopeptide (TPR) repeat protein
MLAAYDRARLPQDRGQLDQCCSAYRTLLARSPHLGETRLNLANALMAMGNSPQAIVEYRRAVALLPDSVEAHFNLGLALLQSGDWVEGWWQHEWRLRRPDRPQRQFTRPRWDGSPIAGKRILIHSEPGLGNTIQFSRFAPLVSDLGGRVLLECPSPLTRLLTTLDGVEGVMPENGRIPEYDCHAPLLSLPFILGTTLDNLPRDGPYLLADSDLVERWSESLSAAADPMMVRVGLAWSGDPEDEHGKYGSMPSSELNVLAGIPGIAFFDLQPPNEGRLSPDVTLLPMIEQCQNLAETAAAILNLDLVITVDNTMAHLAGALGKPVWTLLPYAAGWTWMLDPADTPWYPTMQLFRQMRPADWQSVLRLVRTQLTKVAQ